MKSPKLRQSGSALLIAVLIVALVGAVGFGLARVSLLQSRLYTLSDAGVAAYHAAESGLEFALAQYRLDNQAELSWEKESGSSGPVVPAYLSNTVQNFTPVRYNLASNLTTSGAANITTSDPQFDVTLSQHEYLIGEEDCFKADVALFPGCGSETHPLGVISPDESTTIYISEPPGGAGGMVSLYARARQTTPATTSTNLNDATRAKGLVTFDAYDGSDIHLRQETYYLGWQYDYNRLVSNGNGLGQYFVPVQPGTRRVTITYYGPNGESDNILNFALVATDSTGTKYLPVTTGLTTIEVVGHAGRAQRRLRATIDRRDGQVLHIFDYALNASDRLRTQ